MLAMFETKAIDFKQLSQVVNLAEGTLTPIVNRLVSMGFITKIKNKEDHRKIDIALTDKGKALNAEIIEVPLNLANKLQLSFEKYNDLIERLDELDSMLNDAVE